MTKLNFTAPIIGIRLTFMADKRRKFCKMQLEIEPLVVDKQPRHIPTGKLIELLITNRGGHFVRSWGRSKRIPSIENYMRMLCLAGQLEE